MKNVFLDTNVVLDMMIQDRDDHENALKMIRLCNAQKMNLQCAWHTLSILDFIGKKKIPETNRAISQLIASVSIPQTGTKEAKQALKYDNEDFEDAMQIVSALKGGADCILTNDRKGGFDKSPIPVMSTKQFLESLTS